MKKKILLMFIQIKDFLFGVHNSAIMKCLQLFLSIISSWANVTGPDLLCFDQADIS